MVTEHVGYCRLYDSIGCSISEREEIEFNTKIGEIDIVVYIGPRPKRGIVITSNTGKYVIPDGVSSIGEWKFYKDASLSGYPHNFFTEVQCLTTVEVSDEISRMFWEKSSDAQNKIIDLAEKESANLKRAADLIAGIIGLRFHRQFVLELINERFFAIRDESDWVPQVKGDWLEILEELTLNPNGIKALTQILGAVQNAHSKAHKFGSSIFFWLLRAWAERDSITKFMALFIPLEIALGQMGKEEIENEKEKYFEKTKQIIMASHNDYKDEILKFIEELEKSQQPSLVTRFEALAQEAKLSGYEIDIVAFKKFNRIRNFLLHRGDPNIRLTVVVGEKETQQLEDLVERYVSWVLYRDNIVYQSRWRPKRAS